MCGKLGQNLWRNGARSVANWGKILGKLGQNPWKNGAKSVGKWSKISGKMEQNQWKNGAKSVEKQDRSLALPGTSLCNPVQMQDVDLGVILDAPLLVFYPPQPWGEVGWTPQGGASPKPPRCHQAATPAPGKGVPPNPTLDSQPRWKLTGGDRNEGPAQPRVFNIDEW